MAKKIVVKVDNLKMDPDEIREKGSLCEDCAFCDATVFPDEPVEWNCLLYGEMLDDELDMETIYRCDECLEEYKEDDLTDED